MPGLAGDYFGGSLTYLCEHNEHGAMGLIVNRPSNFSLAELLSQVGLNIPHSLADATVLDGGPVAPVAGFVLHSSETTIGSSVVLNEALQMSTGLDVLEAIANEKGPTHYLVTIGYAGWDAGQLEAEIAANVWLTVPADPTILFELPHSERLHAAAMILGIDFSLISARPGQA